jgi:rare lipoprotein A
MSLNNVVFLLSFFVVSYSFSQIGSTQKGMASYYHDKFHGRRTASGEIYNQMALTAAHRKFLFNTMVKVTNLNNDKSVIVRINDRGPYKYEGRVIDLTLAAAKKIGVIRRGVVPVKLEVIGKDGKISGEPILDIPGALQKGKCYNFKLEERVQTGFGVQIAYFKELLNATYYANVVFRDGFGEVVIKVDSYKTDSTTNIYKVIVGEYKDKQNAYKLAKALKKRQFSGVVVRY